MRLWIVVLLRRGRERGKDVRCDGDRAEVLAQGGNGTCGPARRGTAVGRRPGNGNEALLDGKSRRAGRVRKGGRRAAFSQGSAGISCRRKAETTWPASCSRASLFDIVELSTIARPGVPPPGFRFSGNLCRAVRRSSLCLVKRKPRRRQTERLDRAVGG